MTHRHTEQTCGCQEGGGVGKKWTGSLGLADVNYYIDNKQQGQHRELDSISW